MRPWPDPRESLDPASEDASDWTRGASSPPAGLGPRSKTTKRLVHAAALLSGAVLIVLLLDHIGWARVGASLVGLGVGGAILVMAVGAFEPVFDSLSLRAAARRRIGRVRSLVVNQACAFANTFLPGEAGEFWKASLMRRAVGDAGVPATIIWNYAFKLTKPFVALVAALAAYVFGAPEQRGMAAIVTGAAVLAFLPYIALRLLLRRGLTTVAIGALARVPVLKRRIGPELVRSARDVDHVVRSFAGQHPRAYAEVLASQVAARAASFLCGLAALSLIADGYTVPTVALIYAGQSVLSYVLLLLPTRVGTTEGGTFLLFQLLGLDGGVGLVYAVVMRLKNLLNSAAGFGALMRERL